MSRFQTKAIAICAELFWWGGLAGLIYESFTAGLSVGVYMMLAMCVSLRFFCAINGMTIRALLRLIQKYRIEVDKLPGDER